MSTWLLPEYVEDILPAQALVIERLRARLLEVFRVHGYELVIPPFLEYTNSLLTGMGHDLDLRTFRLVDQLSGRMMGVRADMTPQVARIDAHLLNRKGVTRLCYCGTVLHTRPRGLMATREPMQTGAEIYGHGSIESDIEIQQLLRAGLKACGLGDARLDISHVGVFGALARHAGIDAALESELLDAAIAKDRPRLRTLAQRVAGRSREAFIHLPDLYGGPEVVARARALLPDYPDLHAALDDIEALIATFGPALSIDLADLRGYHYHSGLVFAAYHDGMANAIALGGRYDEVGKAFGRARPATGFSLDLREWARLAPAEPRPRGIAAPHRADAALQERIAALRTAGEIVVVDLSGHAHARDDLGCDRQLVLKNGNWEIVSI
jgi:ATP phosphoribosyltransferase regulatory subunit